MIHIFFRILIMLIYLFALNPVFTPKIDTIKGQPIPATRLSDADRINLQDQNRIFLPNIMTVSNQQVLQRGEIIVSCSNSLSDAAAINAAITDSAKGAEIVIDGQCLINQTIKLLGDRSYRGNSRTGTSLKQADGANLVALLATDTFLGNQAWTGTPISIRQMTLDGNSLKNQQAQTDGIIMRSWLSSIEDMLITDMRGNGIRLTNKSANGTELTTTQVNGHISDNQINQSGLHGIYVEDSQNAVTDWTLIDNWIAFSGMDGIHLENAAGWTIERNHIYGVPQNAIYAHRLWGTSVSDNLIEDFGETDSPGTWHGIYASIQGGATSTISNNRVYNLSVNLNSASHFRYIYLTENYGTGMVSVMGNAIRGVNLPDETGLYFSAGGVHQLILISYGNLIENVTQARVTEGNVTLSGGY